MIGDIRIRVKSRAREKTDGRRLVCNMAASWTDVEIFVLGADGSEIPLTGVRGISFVASDDDNEPLSVTLHCLVDELDIEAQAVLSSPVQAAAGEVTDR